MRTHRAAAARALVAVAALLGGLATSASAGAAVAGRAAPTITSVSLSVLNQGETSVALIDGTHFASGATVSLGPDVTSHVTSVTATRLTVQWTVAIAAQVGARTVTVTVPGGASASDRHAVHLDFAPIFTRWAVGQGATDWGTSLVRPAFLSLPTLRFGGVGVHVASDSLDGTGHLDVALTIASSAAATWRSMTITEGLSTWTIPHGLKVRAAPSVTSMTPLGQGATQQTVTVRGTGFESCKTKPPTVAVSGGGVTVNWASDALGTLIYANLTVSLSASVGARDVTVTNCDSGGTATGAGVFSVLGAPDVASVAPIAVGVRRVETFHGTNFTLDTTLTVSGTGVSCSEVHYVSPEKLRATITVSPTAALGTRSVTASDTGGLSTTATGVLSVDPLPTEAAATPGGIGANTTDAVTLAGTGFEAGATVVVLHGTKSDPAVRVDSVTVASATRLSVVLSALDDVALGTDTLEVLNPDGGAASTLSLRTDPGPHLTSLSPSATTQGVLVATFTAPAGAPAGEAYGARACRKGAAHPTCVSVASFHSGGRITGLVPGARYYAVITSATSGTYYAAASNLMGPVVATVQLGTPVLTSVAPSLSRGGQVVARFTRPLHAPSTQRYTARACRNAAMTTACVTRTGYASGAQLTGLVAGDSYFVTVRAVASPGYLAATSKVSLRVLATVQLLAPRVTHTAYPGGTLEITYARSANALASQAYTATACRNKAMTSGCVVHKAYRSGAPFAGLAKASYYVRVTAVASYGHLAASSPIVEALRP